jgi:hypothetical protein
MSTPKRERRELLSAFGGKGFSALLQIDADSSATRTEVDETFRAIQATAGATNIKEIEPYD